MSLRQLASKAVMILEDEEVFTPGWKEEAKELANALRAALAEPEPEPVAWMYREIQYDGTYSGNSRLIWIPECMDFISEEQGAKATPLYAYPPQRQPLSDEEIIQIGIQSRAMEGPHILPVTFARAIEEAHGIGGDK